MRKKGLGMPHRPRKRFGQNFLVEKNIRSKIIQACAFNADDIVLEIGAGRGEMTGLISQEAKKVYAVEVDRDLQALLKEKFRNRDNVEIISQDILKFDLRKRFDSIKKKIIVFGNIPYYISTPIIERIFDSKEKVSAAFLTVQKEFAKRIVAKPGSKIFGALSCFVQYHSTPEILLDIDKGCFFPVPKVDSSFLRLEIRNKPLLAGAEEKAFFRVVRAAFNMRRKTLRNSLSGIVNPEALEKFFKDLSFDRNARPEELKVSDFIDLARISLESGKINKKKA